MSQTIIVPTLAEPTRLDKFVVAALPNISRSRIQDAIREGHIQLNNKRVEVHHFLKTGDTVHISELDPAAQLTLRPDANVVFTIVCETSDFLVIDKPSGLVVHPAPGVSESTLAAGLLARYPELVDVGEDPLRPGIVHRLDREVSGLMVVARTPAAFTHLKQQFQERLVDKRYTALIVGRPANTSGTITFPLARSKRDHGKVAARASTADDTRDAITHYEVTHQYQQVALLQIKIDTGRTHQIRAHLAALGYPIVGDNIYRPKNLSFKSNPGRLFLHASALTFTAPDGTSQSFQSSLPPELSNFLNQLH